MLKARSRAIEPGESGQSRKAAAVSRSLDVPRGSLAGANCLRVLVGGGGRVGRVPERSATSSQPVTPERGQHVLPRAGPKVATRDVLGRGRPEARRPDACGGGADRARRRTRTCSRDRGESARRPSRACWRRPSTARRDRPTSRAASAYRAPRSRPGTASTSSRSTARPTGRSRTRAAYARRCSTLRSPGRMKVYIIDEAHMLTREAFNALLKTLEEPPPHVVFVMATTEPGKIPETITSRCQTLRLPPHLDGRHRGAPRADRGCREVSRWTSGALKLVAARADGSMRDADQPARSADVGRERHGDGRRRGARSRHPGRRRLLRHDGRHRGAAIRLPRWPHSRRRWRAASTRAISSTGWWSTCVTCFS